MTKEIWVQFKDMESYRENGVRLCTLLRETPGECAAFIYIKDIKNVRELNTYSFDEKQIELLNDAFGEENVRYQERKIKKEIKWSRPTKVPKIKQIISCNDSMYAVMTDADGEKYKCKVLMYALCDDGNIYPLHFDSWLGISPLDEAAFDVELYEMETMITATVLRWTMESLVYASRVSVIRFSAVGSLPPCFPLTGSWKPPFCTGQN